MKYQILFPGKNKKNIINLLSAEFAQRVVKIKVLITTEADNIFIIITIIFIIIILFFFIFFWENKVRHFIWIDCLVDNTHEIPSLIFSREQNKNFGCGLLILLSTLL